MTWLAWIAGALRTKLGQGVALALFILGVLGLYGKRRHSQGRTEAEQEAQDADRENADDIRRRARDADGVPVDDDDRGWRGD